MRRKLFSIFAAFSLAGFLGHALWWARSQFGDEVWVRCTGGSLVIFGADESFAAGSSAYFDPTISTGAYVGRAGNGPDARQSSDATQSVRVVELR
jgi:hypothetical protein